MASIAIKEVQAHSEGMKIEFDVHLGISLNDTDLETDQFKLGLSVKFMGDTLFHIGRRWEIHVAVRKTFQILLPTGSGSSYYYDYFRLPENLDSTVGVEQARRVRAIASLVSATSGCMEKFHEELIKSADGRERDIHIKVPIVIDYQINPFDESPHFDDYLDTISLENFEWDVEALLESDVTRAKDAITFCREVRLIEDRQFVDEFDEVSND